MALRKEGFWDEHYKLELKNYTDNGDEGEIWFGKGLSRKIVDWIIAKLETKANEGGVRFIDIGCGNAFLALALIEKLNSLNMVDIIKNLEIHAIDYSSDSIQLSESIATDRGYRESISLERCDFLNLSEVQNLACGKNYDFIVDKGTYDAICLLAGESEVELRDTKDKYIRSLFSLVNKFSHFLLASCNNTDQELFQVFEELTPPSHEFKMIDKIETPKIQFGGKEGSQVTCIILKLSRKSRSH